MSKNVIKIEKSCKAPSPINNKTKFKYVELCENGINLVNFGKEFLAQEQIQTDSRPENLRRDYFGKL